MRLFDSTMGIVVVLFLLFAGCGKSDEQKQMESDLNNRLLKFHDEQMAKVLQAESLNTELDSALAMHDSLGAARRGEADSTMRTRLASAKQRLTKAQAAMDAWMGAYQPYDESMKHDEAMSTLTKEIDELTRAGTQLDTAITDVTNAIESHRLSAGQTPGKPASARARQRR